MSFKELSEIADQNGAIRAGATIDPERRKRTYGADGYSGTMFYSWTENMRRAENRLFEQHTFRHNIHNRSNCQPESGYVYVIKGKLYGQQYS